MPSTATQRRSAPPDVRTLLRRMDAARNVLQTVQEAVPYGPVPREVLDGLALLVSGLLDVDAAVEELARAEAVRLEVAP